MNAETSTRRYELIALGVVGIFFTYFMPQLAGKLIGFDDIQVSVSVWADMTNAFMVFARLGCGIYSIRLIVIGFKKTNKIQR